MVLAFLAAGFSLALALGLVALANINAVALLARLACVVGAAWFAYAGVGLRYRDWLDVATLGPMVVLLALLLRQLSRRPRHGHDPAPPADAARGG